MGVLCVHVFFFQHHADGRIIVNGNTEPMASSDWLPRNLAKTQVLQRALLSLAHARRSDTPAQPTTTSDIQCTDSGMLGEDNVKELDSGNVFECMPIPIACAHTL